MKFYSFMFNNIFQFEKISNKFHVILTMCYCCSVAKSCLTLGNPMDCSMPSSSVLHYLQSLLKFISIELVMLSNPLILFHPLLLLPSIFPSIRVFSNEMALCNSGQNFGASASVLPVNIQGWFSFRIDWFDLLTVQGTLKSLLQHHSSKASILHTTGTSV